MTVQQLTELVERIHKSLVHDAYDTNDITRLIHISLNQKETLDQLAADNERLTHALEVAGKHIDQLEAIEPMTHLVQYAEGSN
jgi:cell division protein FtsX